VRLIQRFFAFYRPIWVGISLAFMAVGHFSDLGKKSQSHGPKCPDLQAHLGWEFWPGSKKGALEILENFLLSSKQNQTKTKHSRKHEDITNTSITTTKQLHNYTTTQLHNYTITQLHNYTVFTVSSRRESPYVTIINHQSG
jgi:hypothetical protein